MTEMVIKTMKKMLIDVEIPQAIEEVETGNIYMYTNIYTYMYICIYMIFLMISDLSEGSTELLKGLCMYVCMCIDRRRDFSSDRRGRYR
jgi:hypothetical protein